MRGSVKKKARITRQDLPNTHERVTKYGFIILLHRDQAEDMAEKFLGGIGRAGKKF